MFHVPKFFRISGGELRWPVPCDMDSMWVYGDLWCYVLRRAWNFRPQVRGRLCIRLRGQSIQRWITHCHIPIQTRSYTDQTRYSDLCDSVVINLNAGSLTILYNMPIQTRYSDLCFSVVVKFLPTFRIR